MRNLSNNIAICLFLTLVFSSCITNKQKLYLQDAKKEQNTVFSEYRLAINDEIVYYLMTTMSETQSIYNGSRGGMVSTQNMLVYRIYEDGCVVLPTIGRVNIAGRTIKEAERIISEKFKTIVLDAEIKITLANNYFYVQGDGGKGQFYVYKENLNIFQALAMAGDISSIGDKKNIKIIRRGTDGKDYIHDIDLRKGSIISSDFYYIYPNDVIYIPTNSNSFFRIESVSNFVSLVVAPLSLVVMALSFFN